MYILVKTDRESIAVRNVGGNLWWAYDPTKSDTFTVAEYTTDQIVKRIKSAMLENAEVTLRDENGEIIEMEGIV